MYLLFTRHYGSSLSFWLASLIIPSLTQVVNRISWIVHQHCHSLGGKTKGSCTFYGVYSCRQGRETRNTSGPSSWLQFAAHWQPKFKHMSPTLISHDSHTSLVTQEMVTYTRKIIHAHYNQYFHASITLRDRYNRIIGNVLFRSDMIPAVLPPRKVVVASLCTASRSKTPFPS